MNKQLQVYKYGNRYRTQNYSKEGNILFALSEKTSAGVLLTEFNEHGEVMLQQYLKKNDALNELKDHLPSEYMIEIIPADKYEPVSLDTNCTSCSKGQVVRELDLVEPALITHIPVVPLFVCRSCNKKFYSLTKTYLKSLVNSNLDLFEKEELAERAKNEDKFIETLNEYIIRIFASKNIKRISVGKS